MGLADNSMEEYERGQQDCWEEHGLPYGDEKFQLGMAVGLGIAGMFEAIRMRAYPGGVSDRRSYDIGFNQGYSEGREDGYLDGLESERM